MHAHDRAPEHRVDSTPARAPRSTTSPRVPAGIAQRPGSAPSPDLLLAVQRTAGNAAATRLVQRTAEAEQQSETSSSAAQQGRAYELTPEQYREAGFPLKLYRSVRIRSSTKTQARTKERITAPPDGDLGAGIDPGTGISARNEVTRIYQTLKQWPDAKDIHPVDPNADLTVSHHVGGEDYGTQYISFTPDRDRAIEYSRYNFKLGPVGAMDRYRPKLAVIRWAPVIEIDVEKLGPGNRLVNLGDPGIADQTNINEKEYIKSMAQNDREVLITGTVPAGAVTQVHGVEDMLRKMSEDVRSELLKVDYKLEKRPTWESHEQEQWDRAYRLHVPEYFDEHFQHVRQPPEREHENPAPPAGRKRPPARQSPPPPESLASQADKKPKKKQKRSKTLLSFDPDEDM
ncbi:hypothetical protein [Saccharopolyspora shandongensis]|uniref:hypothetical protein n=1 Tax=Saccharopolyspora shandongensis TaxID=418495 RepID=UPI0033E235AA